MMEKMTFLIFVCVLLLLSGCSKSNVISFTSRGHIEDVLAGAGKCGIYNNTMILNLKNSDRHTVVYNLTDSDYDTVTTYVDCSETIIFGGEVQ